MKLAVSSSENPANSCPATSLNSGTRRGTRASPASVGSTSTDRRSAGLGLRVSSPLATRRSSSLAHAGRVGADGIAELARAVNSIADCADSP